MRLSPVLRVLLATYALTVVWAMPARGAEQVMVDGWHTWRVSAIDNMPEWCCYDWNAGNAAPKTCDLDSNRMNFGSRGEPDEPPQYVQIYAYFQNGEIDRLRSLTPRCAVQSDSPLIDKGVLSATDSLQWITPKFSGHDDQAASAFAAVASHRGSEARDFLLDMAEDDPDLANRKDAVFWLAQLRPEEVADEVGELVRNDDSPEMRQHALFSYAQSDASDRVDMVISVIEDRNLPQSDRKRALFWLAQTDTDDAIVYLERMLTH